MSKKDKERVEPKPVPFVEPPMEVSERVLDSRFLGSGGGGLTPSRLLSDDTTHARCIKPHPGQLHAFILTNFGGSARFVKFYDKVTAPQVGIDPPALTLVVGGKDTFTAEFSTGIVFTHGIWVAITGKLADSDMTEVATNEVLVSLFCK